MSWPEDDLLTDALDDDTDSLAGAGNAREQLLAAVQKLQAVLAQAGEGAVLYTDQNDGSLAKLAANTFPAAQTVQTLNTALLLLAHTGAAPGILAEYRSQGTKRWSVRNTAAHAMQWLNGSDAARFSVDQNAQLLALTQNDITYGGQSLLSGVGWSLLESWNPSGGAHEFVFNPNLYSAIKLVAVGTNSTGSESLYMRLGYNDGNNIITSNNYYQRGYNTPPGPIVDAGSDNDGLLAVWAPTLGELGFELDLVATGNAGVAAQGKMFTRSVTTAGLRSHTVIRTDANVIDTIQIRWGGSVQFANAGLIHMYGLSQ